MQFTRTIGAAALFAAIVISVARVGAQTVNDVYTYTGVNQGFVVPNGVSSLDVRLWGAGGGGFSDNGGMYGGGGAYVWGSLAVTPGEDLTVLVGGGGQGYTIFGVAGGFGGGGEGGISGAGRSGLLNVNAELVDAGAGGGSGMDGGGGAGGVDTGGAGSGSFSGGGGTQSVGGAGGVGGPGDGASFQGGSGSLGGGGGGYYGGGAGGLYFGLVGDYIGGGGGGGSSYTTNAAFALASGAGGIGANPGNPGDSFYIAGVGDGSDQNGGNGEIVISYQRPSTPEPGALALLLGAGTAMISLRWRGRRQRLGL